MNKHRFLLAAALMAAASSFLAAATDGGGGGSAQAATDSKSPAKTFNYTEVDSSQIAKIGHDGDTTMRVQFKKGGEYEYANVDVARFNAVLAGVHDPENSGSPSVGKAFHQLVKLNPTAYPFTKL